MPNVCVLLQMWSARLALLVAMQQYREAEVEMEAFGDLSNPDLYYQYHTHNYPEQSGEFTVVCVCESLPLYSPVYTETLNRFVNHFGKRRLSLSLSLSLSVARLLGKP